MLKRIPVLDIIRVRGIRDHQRVVIKHIPEYLVNLIHYFYTCHFFSSFLGFVTFPAYLFITGVSLFCFGKQAGIKQLLYDFMYDLYRLLDHFRKFPDGIGSISISKHILHC